MSDGVFPNGNYIGVTDVESYVNIDFTSVTPLTESEVGNYIVQVEAEMDAILSSCGITVPIEVNPDDSSDADQVAKATATQTRYRLLLKSYGVKAVVAAVVASGNIRPGVAAADRISSREEAYMNEFLGNLDRLREGCTDLFPDADGIIEGSGLPAQARYIIRSPTWEQQINIIQLGLRNTETITGVE